MKDIKIKIQMEQQDSLGEKNNVDFTTEAKLYIKNDGIYIIYKETELTGMEDTTTTIKIQNNKVAIKRFGKNNSNMIFEKDKEYISRYQISQGFLNMNIFTRELRINTENIEKLNLYIEYDLNLTNLFEGYNKLTLSII